MRLYVVHNPESGDQRWTAGKVEKLLRAAGHEPRIVPKEDWKGEVPDDADALVASGGDGTVHKLIHALAGLDVPLGILPIGTANNVALAYGWDPDDTNPTARIRDWHQNGRGLRLVNATAKDEHRQVVEAVGAGAFARVIQEGAVRKRRRPLMTMLAGRKRLLQEVLDAPAIPTVLEVDGKRIEGEYVLTACLKLPSFGPRLLLAGDQSPNSHTMTVVGVPNAQRGPFARWLVSGEGSPAAFQIAEGSAIALAAAGPTHADDRIWPEIDTGGRLELDAEGGGTVSIMV